MGEAVEAIEQKSSLQLRRGVLLGQVVPGKALVLVEDAATSTGWSAAGTYVGVNAAGGFTGNLLDLQLNGVSKFKVDSTGAVTASSFAGNVTGNITGSAASFTDPFLRLPDTSKIVKEVDLPALDLWRTKSVNLKERPSLMHAQVPQSRWSSG